MPAVFVTGTGTDIGKTYVACGVIRALRAKGVAVEAFKPVVSGFDDDDWAGSDPGRLLDALDRPLTPETLAAMSPWRFSAPVSPHLAARMEGRTVDFAELVAACRQTIDDAGEALLLIEGAGGVMSPLTTHATNLDLMAALGAPALLVTGSYLGAISHTLTALAALSARGLHARLLVVNETPMGGAVEDIMSSISVFDPTPSGKTAFRMLTSVSRGPEANGCELADLAGWVERLFK